MDSDKATYIRNLKVCYHKSKYKIGVVKLFSVQQRSRKLKRTPLKHGESYFKVIYLYISDILLIIR